MADDSTPDHLREFSLPLHLLERWCETAEYLAKVNGALVPEVKTLGWECTPHNLMRCAMAARYIAASEVEPFAGAAKTLAAEFEEMAERQSGPSV